jgi:hypothetical protein
MYQLSSWSQPSTYLYGNDDIQVNGVANVFASGGAGDDSVTVNDRCLPYIDFIFSNTCSFRSNLLDSFCCISMLNHSQLSLLLGDEGMITIQDQFIASATQSYHSWSSIYSMNPPNVPNMMFGNDYLMASTLLLPSNRSQSIIFGGQADDTIITHNVCAVICGDNCQCKSSLVGFLSHCLPLSKFSPHQCERWRWYHPIVNANSDMSIETTPVMPRLYDGNDIIRFEGNSLVRLHH